MVGERCSLFASVVVVLEKYKKYSVIYTTWSNMHLRKLSAHYI